MLISAPRNRYQAFAIHILVSAIIFLVLSLLIYFCLYPGFLFQTDGGWQGIRLIAGVDFIIGPVLTLLVYRLGKPGLKFDLALIGLVQICCLAAGCWIVYQERPLAVIYSDGKFHTMAGGAYEMHQIDPGTISGLKPFSPTWFFVEEPADQQQRFKLLTSQLKDGPLYLSTNLYRPYKDHLAEVFSGAHNDREYIKKRPAAQMYLDSAYIYPLESRYSDGYIAIDKTTGKCKGIITIGKK